MKLGDWLVDLGFTLVMATLGYQAYRKFLRSAKNPYAAQQRALHRTLALLAPTAFGRASNLDTRYSIDDFRAATPIFDYEALRPWIERQIAGEAGAIAPEKPLMYARTSGTTGAPKLVPVTSQVLRGLRRAQRAMVYAQHRRARVFRGKLLAIGGVSREITLPDGTPAGATTGLVYETMPCLIRAKYIIPAVAFGIEDPDLKYATIVRLAVQHRDISAIATANPSTILRLAQFLAGIDSQLVAEIASGEFSALTRLTPDQARAVRTALHPAPERAHEVGAFLQRGTPPGLADLWPDLRAVVTWTQGSCALAAKAVAAMLPPTARVIEAGYVSSELRGTVVVEVERGLGLPLLDDVFFEFAPVDAWDQGIRQTMLLHELKQGHDYQVFVTTAAGLVRYQMNDIVRATEPIGSTPTLAFVRKGRGVTNITGEKLSEDQVAGAMQRIAVGFELQVPFYVFVAEDEKASYMANIQLGAEAGDGAALAASIDDTLCELNIEYLAKRKSGRLKPLRARLLSPEAAIAYRRHLVAKGQREAQLKVLTLQRLQDCDFDFEPYALGSAHAS